MNVSLNTWVMFSFDVVTNKGLKLQKIACSDFIICCEINAES